MPTAAEVARMIAALERNGVRQSPDALSALAEAVKIERAAPAKPLYPNQRCAHEGIPFDSLAERDSWIEASWRERAGDIRNLVPNPSNPKKRRFELQGGVFYTPDMTYEERRGDVWVKVAKDVKGAARGRGRGTKTREFVRAAKQFRAGYPDWELVIEER